MKITAGLSIEFIYEDRAGNITQRKITVRGVCDGLIEATDLSNNQLRTFKMTNILAWSPIKQTA